MAVVLEIIDLVVCWKIHGCGCVADDPLASKSIWGKLGNTFPSHSNELWWPPSSQDHHGAPLPALRRHTSISQHATQQFYVVKTRVSYFD
jgi:hypothetical protein